jgi:hypothetical protein
MPEITMGLFVGWLALLVAMMVVSLPGRKMYWERTAAFSCPLFLEWGSHRYFEELLSIFFLPEHGPGDPEYIPDDPLQSVRKWFDLLATFWGRCYCCGLSMYVHEITCMCRHS